MMDINQQISHPLAHLAVGMAALLLLSAPMAQAQEGVSKPLLIIGASLANGNSPIDNNLSGPYGGFAVNYGSYLSLGNALIRTDELNGLVINEAEAGATTFPRLRCGWYSCLTTGWQGYDVMFQKALSRVTLRDPANPAQIVGYNADYLYIAIPNDCLHSGAMGVPHTQTAPCTVVEMNDVIDRLEAVANQALDIGITPVFSILPQYHEFDMPLFKQKNGLYWVINEEDFNTYRDLYRNRIHDELPEAIQVDAWAGFVHLGDGIHPNAETATRAAKRIAKAIKQHEKGK